MCRDYTFVDLITILLKFTPGYDKEYSKIVLATCTVFIVNDMMRSNILRGMRDQIYYRYIRVARLMLRHKSLLALIKSLNGEDVGWRNWSSTTRIKLGCTRQPWRSCKFSLERQETSYRTRISQIPSTCLYLTLVRRSS